MGISNTFLRLSTYTPRTDTANYLSVLAKIIGPFLQHERPSMLPANKPPHDMSSGPEVDVFSACTPTTKLE